MSRDAEFIYEMGMLRHLPRQWNRFGGINFANLADHHFRVTWIALVVAAREGVKDTTKIIKMALAHDIAESRTNDVDYISRQYTVRNEHLAIQDMLASTGVEKEFLELLHEYEKRESIESKIVKDADNLDVDFELKEQASNGITIEGWNMSARKDARNRLFTESAKQLFDEINDTNPHAWHNNSARNRVNGGDWQHPKKPKTKSKS